VNGSRERDQAVEQLLRQSLPRSGSASDACLDAETLAAWADGGLSGDALEMAQSHVADCARCQAMVGAQARIDSRVPQVNPERAARPWLAWLVPLTAAAAAIAIWVAVPRNSSAPVSPSSNVQQPEAQSKLSPPPALSEPRTQPRGEPKGALSEPRTQPRGESKGALSEPRTQLRGESKGAPLRGRDQAKTPASDQKKDMSGAEATELRKESAQLESERTRSPAGRSAAPAPASAPIAAAPPALADKAVGVTPDSSVRWRIAGSGLERSTNNGLLWEAAPTGVAAELTAVAAPSASVCWVVGRGGVVLLSTDGRSWRRVPFPETTDLSAVQARDARSASVSTTDGRTFSTTDGGVTWVRRPLQEF
jgi:hypothetical protein